MSFYKKFNSRFSKSRIKQYFFSNLDKFNKVGIDRVNQKNFIDNLDEYSEIISRKVLNGSYNFIPYRQVLIGKGKDKKPRVISIPSIRDRIVLSVLKDILHEEFSDLLNIEYIKKKITRVNKEFTSDKYDTVIKIDMENFYGSLDHDILFNKLWKKVRKKEFKSILTKAIMKQTITMNQHQSEVSLKDKGVPQGLPISNILSDIYMIDFDNANLNSKRFAYFRYVDDILVFCKESESEDIYNHLIKLLEKKLMLKPYKKEDESKTFIKKLGDEFNYLGYKFYGDLITIRKSSVQKLELRIEKLFNDFKNKPVKLISFIWDLNLKITGVRYKGKNYGWVLYFSQINDETLMFRLDNFITKLAKRYKMYNRLFNNSKNYRVKRFVRTYHEIKKNLSDTKYIPNSNNMTEDQKKEILIMKEIAFNKDDLSDVREKFEKLMFNQIKSLNRDINNFS